MTRVLIVEDEESIRESLKLNLELEGFEVVAISNGRVALKCISEQRFDLYIFDVMLPEVDGFELTEQTRIKGITNPILILTAKDTSSDKVTGLKRGADDYLTKPFNLEEFILRVHNLLRRANISVGNMEEYSFGGNKINFLTFEAKGVESSFMLSNKEVMLLKLLVERKGEVVSRQQILNSVWGYDVYPSTRTIDNFIMNFRKYFETDPRNPIYFHSLRSVGYKFTG
jgi:two-component system, OmpR family, alkaline phosphatase synthesis response regulator PhoP